MTQPTTTQTQVPVEVLVQNLAGAKRGLDAARASRKAARAAWESLLAKVGITNVPGATPATPPSPFPDMTAPAAVYAQAIQQESAAVQVYETARSAHNAYLSSKGAI